jgi:hypothetical protein
MRVWAIVLGIVAWVVPGCSSDEPTGGRDGSATGGPAAMQLAGPLRRAAPGMEEEAARAGEQEID